MAGADLSGPPALPVVVGEAGVLGLLVPGRGVPGDGDLLTVQYSTVRYYGTVQYSTVQW